MASLRSPALLLLLSLFFVVFFFSSSIGFQSDELVQDDDEFLELDRARAPDSEYVTRARPATRRRVDPDSAASDVRAVQFALEHSFGGSAFSPAGTFSARLTSPAHGGLTLTKLRLSRNALTAMEKEAFERLLKEDGFYTIRVPSNVLSPPGRDYIISSIRARCLPRETLDEHFVINMERVNILAVNYGSAGACQYPRLLKLPAKWSFNSYTLLKNSGQAPRTPTFAEELLTEESREGEGVKPPEKSFWAKYWMYLIPLGLIVMNAITQAMNMAEEQAPGQSASQTQQAVAQRAPNAAVRRR